MRLLEPIRLLVFAAMLGGAPALAQTAQPSLQRYPAAREVQVRDVAGFVRVTPENRTDVAVSIRSGGFEPPRVRLNGDRLVIDGRLRRQIRDCRIDGEGFQVTTTREGRVSGNELMVIELRVPQNAVVSASGAVRLRVGASQAARIAISGCGDADIARVADEADVSVAGSPDLRLHEAGSATVSLAGAGDIVVGVVHDGLTVSIAGAGDFIAGRADGPTNIAIQGAGDVTIRDGHATTLSVAIAGAGDVVHNGSAERLDAAILGAGDVRVRHVEGEVTRRVLGGGEVIVGR
jgi:hypothetical protein